MPIFEYKAVDSHNKTTKGMVDADSAPRRAVQAPQRAVNLYVTDLEEARQHTRRKVAIKGITGVDVPEQAAATSRSPPSRGRWPRCSARASPSPKPCAW